MAPQKPVILNSSQREAMRRFESIAQTKARMECRGHDWLRNQVDDIAEYALSQFYLSYFAQQKQDIKFPEALIGRIIVNRINDLGRRRRPEQNALMLLDEELPARARNQQQGGVVCADEVIRRNNPMRGLSVDIIQQEDQKMMALTAAAIVAIMPLSTDRALLEDRFYSPTLLTVAELARRHGKKTASAMANYLKKIIGSEDQNGAVEPVIQVINRLPVASAEIFVKILQEYDERDSLSQPILGAISHLEYAGNFSEQHRQQAVLGIVRLRWFERNPINNRGLTNKLLQRLVKAACFYVHEVKDAVNDKHNPRGLSDDVKVLAVVGEVVREFRSK